MFTVQIDTIKTQERGKAAIPLSRVYMPLKDFTGVLESALKDKDCPNRDNVQNVSDLLGLLATAEPTQNRRTRIANLASLMGMKSNVRKQ